jgi:ankyrin repeat protein
VRTVAQIEAEYAAKSRGNTRLGWAALANDQPALEHFIAAGDNVDERSRDAQNHTPLIWASFHQRDSGIEMVRYLLDHKADVNAQQRFGWTPLIIATRSRSPRTVQLLLERGADPKIKSNKGQTALDVAKELGDGTLIKLLAARE